MDILDETTEHIPWQRLTTAYGRGTDIPRLIETRQYKVQSVSGIDRTSEHLVAGDAMGTA
ncbi:hypothetical protein J34TS1_01580 [Paenibacillus azoreducens]|uniref:Uncharacterized protein n=2 Tax=Paenibacillus azoreducens TaxID=116718 RepID=A0A919YA74_9BACL|nr:hypothetical protein J34TS1_01580 [Paenibacillus azoreducens]